ncbi:hypothetical protein K501DRAFT_187079 [Backusella circina FSU 941]|nr:hypothetical protein K501DRAFT_187079 [Backusella circina FSU 941]
MKSVRFALINNRFDDQYTFDLQGYLSVSDFCSTINLFNETVQKCPPPGNKLIWVLSIWILWIIAIVSNYLLWVYTRSSYGLVVLPFFMILTTVLFVWRHRVLRRRFEKTVVNICNRVNATENIRGINYRFSKNGSDLADVSKQIQISSNASFKAIYCLVIEFDDRYNALSSQQFNRYPSVEFVTVPLYAHLGANIGSEKTSTHPAWNNNVSTHDEKVIV